MLLAEKCFNLFVYRDKELEVIVMDLRHFDVDIALSINTPVADCVVSLLAMLNGL
jgi:hypothetical protein